VNDPSLEELAAALAAIERFERDRATPPPSAPAVDPWTRAARLAAVGETGAGGGWADANPWGREPPI